MTPVRPVSGRGRRPSAQERAAAAGSTIPDVIGPGLDVLFCGINPGLWSAAVGHHFAHPGNRFWRTLADAGFTGVLLGPESERELLEAGLGITNLVERSTATAAELGRDELRLGARSLARKVRRYQPAWVAFVGLGAYRSAFGRPGAVVGEQPETLEGSGIWVLPNTSGAQARYQAADLREMFASLRRRARRPAPASGEPPGARSPE